MAKSSYLCFHKGNYHFAIDNSEVLRILPEQSLFATPLPIPSISGLMVMDNMIVAVIDLVSVIFQEDQTDACYHIFINLNQEIIGIGADHIDGIKIIDDIAWEPYHETLLPFISKEAEETLYLIHLK